MKGVLATRRRRADRNQGRVKASANLGRGTTAVLQRIPRFVARPAVSASAEALKGRGYHTGNRGRSTKFEEAAFRVALSEFGSTLTRQNEQQVAERLAVSIRTLWNWHKLLQTNPS